MTKNLTLLLLAISFFSCSGGNAGSAVAQPTDTATINGHKVVYYGKDSLYIFYGKQKRVVYPQAKEGEPRLMIYDAGENLLGMAYKSSILALDSTFYKQQNVPMLSDSLVMYHSNGKPSDIGYVEYFTEDDYKYAKYVWQEYWKYDEHGILTDHIVPLVWGGWYHIGEKYYPNGQLKKRWEQGEAYASGALMSETAWDISGSKVWEDKYEHLMPENGTSYNDLLAIATRTDYYPNGKVMQLSSMKNFVGSEEYPCGEWIRYDSLGKKISVTQYPPCNNFEIGEYPYPPNNTSFEYTVRQVIVAFCIRSSYMLNEFISEDLGLTTLFRRGVYDIYGRTDKFDFDIPVPEYWPYPEYSYRYREIWYEEPPVFTCNDEKWNKIGLYCDTTKVDNLLSKTAENLVKYEGDAFSISAEDIHSFKQLEKNSRKVVLVDEEGELIFYLTLIDGKWYLTILDRVSFDCSA